MDKGREIEIRIEWITREEADCVGTEEERVLIEQSLGHYPEFNAFLRRELERAEGGLFFRGASGMVYRVGPVAEEPGGLSGIEICLRSAGGGGRTISGDGIDRDIWAFLEWVIQNVGGEWTLEALQKVGAIYRIPGAPERV
jgi:hypothetical protein